MEIADYIPDYPEISDAQFNKKIFRKKEFYDLKTSMIPESIQPGKLWNHQKLVARFLAAPTHYDGQLFFHKPGTGKTCAAVAVAEINKAQMMKEKQFVLIIVPNEGLIRQWKDQIAGVCTGGEYVPQENEDEELTFEQRERRRNKLIESFYQITTVELMRREIQKSSEQVLKQRYSNIIIILDEAHHLRIQGGKKEKTAQQKSRYDAFHKFFHCVENTKKILLTGTPMYDDISELATIVNLILPIDQQLPIEAEFKRQYLAGNKLKNEDELLRKLAGRVSYIREGGNFPLRENIGQLLSSERGWTDYIPLVTLEMSQSQLQGYLQARKLDEEEGNLWNNSRQAALFVYPYLDPKTKQLRYLYGNDITKKFVNTSKSGKLMAKRTITIDKEKFTYTKLTLNDEFGNKIKNNIEKLREYSAKYAYIVEFLKKHPREPVFIFINTVEGAGGAEFFSLILELFGYTQALGDVSQPEEKRKYALITGEVKSKVQRNKLISLFNSKENVRGDLIHVMIGTIALAEGTSFKNVQHEIVVAPYWNNSGTEQAIGRGLRTDSLLYDSSIERKVTVQELAVIHPELPTDRNIDAQLYNLSETKDYQIKIGERLLKKVAWDCPFNYARNVRPDEKDFSRNCDYQQCNYSCYQVLPTTTTSLVWKYTDSEIEWSNYLLLYSNEELGILVNLIKEAFQTNSFINVYDLIRTELSVEEFKLIILAIEYIIENNIKIRNKWGLPCFLRKQGNILYLTESHKGDLLTGWYTFYPYIAHEYPLNDLVNNKKYEENMAILDRLDLSNIESTKEQIEQMNLETQIILLEYILKISTVNLEESVKLNINNLLNIFDKQYYKDDKVVIHRLEKINIPAKQVNYEDFTKGSVRGVFRCLYKDKDWSTCDKKDEVKLTNKIQQLQSSDEEYVRISSNPVYGIISAEGAFQIAKAKSLKKRKDGTGDNRTKNTGAVCIESAWKKPALINLYIELGIPWKPIIQTLDNPKLIEISESGNREQLIEIIKEKCDIKKYPLEENISLDKLRIMATLFSLTKTQLCNPIQEWLTANNLMIFEKD